MSDTMIKYGTSSIEDGPMNLACGLPLDIVRENQDTFFRKKGYAGCRIIRAELEQGTNVRVVDRSCPDIAEKTDGLIAIDLDLILLVTVADCLPVWLFDKNQHAFGIVHAGWRGLTDGVLANAVNKFEELGFKPSDLIATIGPHISTEHFEVQADVAERFREFPDAIKQSKGRIFIDLFAFAKAELEKTGLKSMRISSTHECTYSRPDKYYSFRRDKELPLKSQLAYIVKTNV